MSQSNTRGNDQFDYPVEIGNDHRVTEGDMYDGDRFECSVDGAYTHTGAWPTWSYCPYCGVSLR